MLKADEADDIRFFNQLSTSKIQDFRLTIFTNIQPFILPI